MNLNLDKSVWKHVSFGDVVRNVNVAVRDPHAAGIDRVIAMEHIDPGELKIRRWGSIEDGTTFTRRVKPGQTLFGKRRAYQRKVAYAEFDAICSGDILTFEADEVQLLPEFLPFLVQSDAFFDHALGTSAGSLSPRTNWRDLSNFKFHLPPLDEQKRIADLAWAMEHHARALMEQRVAIVRGLAAFSEGVLREFDDQLVEVKAVGSQSVQSVQVGPFGGSLASRHFTATGTRVLKIQNLTDEGEWDLGHEVFVGDDYAATLERYRVRPGDLIVAAQATVGRCSLAPEAVADSLISQHLIRVRFDEEKALPRFMHAVFQTSIVQDQIRAVKTKTTRDGLNTADVEQFKVPCPSLNRQSLFVNQSDAFKYAASAIDRQSFQLAGMRSSLFQTIFGGS